MEMVPVKVRKNIITTSNLAKTSGKVATPAAEPSKATEVLVKVGLDKADPDKMGLIKLDRPKTNGIKEDSDQMFKEDSGQMGKEDLIKLDRPKTNGVKEDSDKIVKEDSDKIVKEDSDQMVKEDSGQMIKEDLVKLDRPKTNGVKEGQMGLVKVE